MGARRGGGGSAAGGRVNAITLFAGAGGADLGMQRAGVRHLACVEGDATACATLRAAGFPAVHAWIGTPPPGSKLTGWRWDGGPVDLLWASPPCQPYSMAGKQLGAADPRDGWPATLEAIQAIRPRWVIIENVGGAPVEGWATALGGLFARYRFPCVSWAALDAANWGLPSHRTRQFLVAGPEPYRWPEPTHCGPDAPVAARLRLLPWVGFEEALGLVGAVRATREVHKPVVEREEQIIKGPCQCIGATYSGNLAGQPYVLTGGRRPLTWQECAILLGFPPGYPFQGRTSAKYRQIGNAVAPVMAEALVRALPG